MHGFSSVACLFLTILYIIFTWEPPPALEAFCHTLKMEGMQLP